MIFEDSLDELDGTLVMRHGAIAGEVSDLNADKAADLRGRLVYHRCMQLDLPLDGRSVPGHFVHGLRWAPFVGQESG